MRLVHGVLWVVLAVGCNKPAAPAATSAGAADPAAKGPSANLTVSEAEALLKSNPMAQLIDVRTLSEWSGGYIAGAKHIPLDQIETRLPEIDKSRTVVLYCAAGGRSHRAMEILK
ncbi:MAG: rhodanese-like domain-containing protein, partial [Deltaproteobacteria bacterium]|nr:rhodanese-like domain-containing protein [Deltaproteobacteria bacterium]